MCVFWLSAAAPLPAAVALAYMIGMIVAFTLFRRFVFPASPHPLKRQVRFFILVNLAGIAQVWAVSMALVYYVFPVVGVIEPLMEPLGHGVAIGVPTISSYFGYRFLTF